MKSWKKWLAILLSAAMLMSLLVACGSFEDKEDYDDEEYDEEDEQNKETDETKSDNQIDGDGDKDSTEKITKLVMATDTAFPPYGYKDGDNFVGIDIEIAAAVAEKLGAELVIEDVAFGAVLTGVAEGKYDLGIAGIAVNENRKKILDFSDTYTTNTQVIIVKDGSSIESLDDLYVFDADGNPIALKNTNIKVGVQTNTTGDCYASSAVESWGFNVLDSYGSIKTDRVMRYKTGTDAITALKAGKIDCFIIDNGPAKSFVEANDGIHILEGDNEYVIEDYAICVDKGNTELLEKINTALAELKADGTIDKIINKYIPA